MPVSPESVGARPDRRATAAVFLVAAFVAWLSAPGLSELGFAYDSGRYWTLADRFSDGGGWSLWNFDDPLRGYVPALLFGAVRGIGDALTLSDAATIRIANALLIAALGVLLAPRIVSLAWPRAAFGPIRRLALVAVLLVFWRGYVSYPLADFPALAAALVALIAVSRAPRPGWMLVAGLAASCAVNLRPAYVLFVPAVLVLAAWNGRSSPPAAGRRRQLAGVAMVLVGLVLVMVPQTVMHERHHDVVSPLPGAPSNLSGFQLQTGLEMQRYETYIGGDRPAQMVYSDPSTSSLVDRLRREGGIEGYGDYLGLLLDEPVTIGGVFVRHVVNGMDQRYSDPYVQQLDDGGQRPLRIAAMLFALGALLRLLWPAARNGLGPARWRYPAALLATCLTVLPSAVETRFLLPVYLLAYLLVLAPGWPRSIGLRDRSRGVRRFAEPVAIVAGSVAFVVLWWTIVDGASSHLG